MKALLAAIALLCLSTSVLAHDIYSNLHDRAGHLCRNGQDCRPVQATVLPNGSYYLPTTNEIIPADRAAPSPDDRFHHCTIQWPLFVGTSPPGTTWKANPRVEKLLKFTELRASRCVGRCSGGRNRPPGRERPVVLFAFLHDDQCQPTYAARCWASASAAVLGCVGSVRTVAFCPSQSRVSKTISPSGNSSAS
jgi:hypothetical protein